jgi:hypothetical protein
MTRKVVTCHADKLQRHWTRWRKINCSYSGGEQKQLRYRDYRSGGCVTRWAVGRTAAVVPKFQNPPDDLCHL